jgi:hypothetical protein
MPHRSQIDEAADTEIAIEILAIGMDSRNWRIQASAAPAGARR